MIDIDGSAGEGGGQVLRTALALSCVLGVPFCMHRIRAKRDKPGLMRQHLTAVLAAAEICSAQIDGAAVGSMQLTFTPGRVRAGAYRFVIGTAGSTMLVLQTVLPPLMLASAPSRIELEGGTHNPFAPPFEFLARVLLPLLQRMGPRVTATLHRYGFFPAGGGRVECLIQPSPTLTPLYLNERGNILTTDAYAIIAALPQHIAQRELDVLRTTLGWPPASLHVQEVQDSAGPGNVLLAHLVSEHGAEVISGFGEKGVAAESVARNVAHDVQRYLAANVPVGEHLADQLLLPLALAGAGSFVTMPLSAHALTNIAVIQKFLDIGFSCVELDGRRWRVTVEGR